MFNRKMIILYNTIYNINNLGSSMGGISVLYQIDNFREMFNPNIRISGIAGSLLN
jgi:hypothetical protein